jgi:hypothetical protein
MSERLFTMRRVGIAALAIALVAVAVVGIGLARKKPSSSSTNAPSKPISNSTDFKAGSKLVVEQTVFPFEGKFETVEPAHNRKTITVTVFDVGNAAEVTWNQTQLVLTDESKAALKAYEDGGKQGAAPQVKYGQIDSGGTLSQIKLGSTHDIGFPLVWALGNPAESKTSEIWVSSDVYQELSRTRGSTVFTKALTVIRPVVSGNAALTKLVGDIQTRSQIIADRTDVDLMKADEARVDYPVKMNGADTTVKAIRAKSWYGEMLVLDNPQNPLILSFAFNPDLQGVQASQDDVNVLKGLLSYNVTEINP